MRSDRRATDGRRPGRARTFLFGLAIATVGGTAVTAWEFTPVPICTLRHDGPSGTIVITYDAAIPEYTLTITTPDPWAISNRFEMRFVGEGVLSIGTDRHTYTDGGRSLSVTDRGFGNVLDGLRDGARVLARSGEGPMRAFDATDAAAPVAAFRACPTPATS